MDKQKRKIPACLPTVGMAGQAGFKKKGSIIPKQSVIPLFRRCSETNGPSSMHGNFTPVNPKNADN